MLTTFQSFLINLLQISIFLARTKWWWWAIRSTLLRWSWRVLYTFSLFWVEFNITFTWCTGCAYVCSHWPPAYPQHVGQARHLAADRQRCQLIGVCLKYVDIEHHAWYDHWNLDVQHLEYIITVNAKCVNSGLHLLLNHAYYRMTRFAITQIAAIWQNIKTLHYYYYGTNGKYNVLCVSLSIAWAT